MLHFVTKRYYNATVLLSRVPGKVVHRGGHSFCKTAKYKLLFAILPLQNCKVVLLGIPELKNPVRVVVHIRITYPPPVEPARPPLNS